jgi:hypothetical protein
LFVFGKFFAAVELTIVHKSNNNQLFFLTDGLNIIFPNEDCQRLTLVRQLVEKQDDIYKCLSIDFPYWYNTKLGLKEIEHALCEYSKFHRIQLSLLSTSSPSSTSSKKTIPQRKTTSQRLFKSSSSLYDNNNKVCTKCDKIIIIVLPIAIISNNTNSRNKNNNYEFGYVKCDTCNAFQCKQCFVSDDDVNIGDNKNNNMGNLNLCRGWCCEKCELFRTK